MVLLEMKGNNVFEKNLDAYMKVVFAYNVNSHLLLIRILDHVLLLVVSNLMISVVRDVKNHLKSQVKLVLYPFVCKIMEIYV